VQDYQKTPGVNNLGLAPTVPASARSFEQRRDFSLRQCRRDGTHRGRARRWRREVQTRDALAHLAGLRAGTVRVSDGAGRQLTLAELLLGGGAGRAAWVRSMQTQARNLLALAERHGPASGWGIAQPPAGAVGNPKWTPYWVAKRAERCWRYWRRVTRALRALLGTLARAWWKVVPLHRALLDQGLARREESFKLSKEPETPTGYRDHSAHGWEAALERARAAAAT